MHGRNGSANQPWPHGAPTPVPPIANAAVMDMYRHPQEQAFFSDRRASAPSYWQLAAPPQSAEEMQSRGATVRSASTMGLQPVSSVGIAASYGGRPLHSPQQASPLTAYEDNLVEGMYLYSHLVRIEPPLSRQTGFMSPPFPEFLWYHSGCDYVSMNG